jgi:hypothetical protein
MFSGVISWMSKRHAVIALSTIEVEYMAATHASKESIWLHRLCSNIGFEQKSMWINCDSHSEIFLEKNLAYHSKSKHIDLQHHFMRDMVNNKKVGMEKVDTLENIADSLTKSVSAMKLFLCREVMGITTLG